MQVISEQLAAPYKLVIVDDDVETLEKRKKEIWEGIKKNIDLRGFRKGQVPRSVVEKRYDLAELYRDVVNDVLQRGITESGLSVCALESATIVDWRSENPLKIEAIVDVNPKVLQVEYKGIQHGFSKLVEVTDENINATVERTRESLATIQSIETERPAQNNDLVTISFKGTIKGKAFEGGSADNYQLKLGTGVTIAGFEDAIIGMTIGETKEVELVFPDDYANTALAKKQATFTITLTAIHEMILPDVDDEMAKDAGYDTLEEMRVALKKDLEEANQQNYNQLLQAELLQKLIENAQIEPIPDSLVEKQLQSILRELISHSGCKDEKEYFEKTKQKRESFNYQYTNRALEDIKAKLVLEYIAATEGFVVTDEERDEYIRTNAAKMNISPDRFKQLMSAESLDLNIRMQRANAFVADHAEITYE